MEKERKPYQDVSKYQNWMSEFLTPELYERLKNRRTASGFTIDHCIQSGLVNPTHAFIKTVGLVAGDEECYSLFAELFDPVISSRHSGYDLSKMHITDLNPDILEHGDTLDPKYVLSCRIRASRNIKGFCLTAWCNREERRKVEDIVRDSLDELPAPLKGQYRPIADMDKKEHEQLISQHILFHKPPSLYIMTNMAQNWPESRGIWYNTSKNLIVWVNEEDHLRIISMQKGSNMRETFERICNGLNKIEEALRSKSHSFMFSNRLGFISTCPCNLGTGLRASVHLRIPLLSKQKILDVILGGLKLQKRGPGGAETAPDSDTIDISNADRLGSTELEQVQSVVNGVKLIIEMEKRLERGCDIADLIPQCGKTPRNIEKR